MCLGRWHVSASWSSSSWMQRPSFCGRAQIRFVHPAQRPSGLGAAACQCLLLIHRILCVAYMQVRASSYKCIVYRVLCSHVTASSSYIVVYSVLCVLCVHVGMSLIFLLQDATPVRGWAASSCTPGTTTVARAPLHVSASSLLDAAPTRAYVRRRYVNPAPRPSHGPGCPSGSGGGQHRRVVRRVRKVEPLEVRPPAPPHLRVVRPGGILLGGEVS